MSEYTADLTEMLLTAAEPEPHIVIAADRSVLVPDDLKEIAAQFDHNIETVTFDCPRYWDGHDFSKMHVFVNYRCADGKIDSYPCDLPAVDAEDETIIHFDWTLSRNVTCAKGVISFLVCVKSSDENGVLQNQWSSRLNQEMEVLEGIECNTEEIIPDEPDVIERILNRLDELERNGGGSNVNAELPFTENEISGVASGGGFVVNPTNFADGKTYFRYHAGSTYGFRWKNPNKQKGSLTITVRGYSQYSNTLNTRIVTVYTDGSDNGVTDAMYLRHGETITYTTDPNKTVDYIRGNYDFENWVLLDMDVLSIVADYLSPTGTVKSVNGILPDENGNVEIEIPECGGSGGDYIPAPATASVGQTIKVSAVDANGKPTAWEAVDLAKSYEYLIDLAEDVESIDFDFTDSEGNPIMLNEILIVLHIKCINRSGCDTTLKYRMENGTDKTTMITNNYASAEGDWVLSSSFAKIQGRTIYCISNKNVNASGSSPYNSTGANGVGIYQPRSGWGDRWMEGNLKPIGITGVKIPGAMSAKSQIYIYGVKV